MFQGYDIIINNYKTLLERSTRSNYHVETKRVLTFTERTHLYKHKRLCNGA